MTIESLTITPEDLNEAVHQWLQSKYQIGCKVMKVSKRYTHYTDFTVELETEPPVKAEPPLVESEATNV